MNITFIGGGNMATALIGGILAKGFDASAIHVVDPVPTARRRLSESLGVACFESVQQLVSLDDVIVLAVKPQQMRVVSADLYGRLSDQLVLSIAAGIRLRDLARWLGGHDRLARCMPNTPALIGQGISGLYANQTVSAEQRAQAQGILEAVGQVVWVHEEEALDAVTAVSGSGPAYVFYFIEAMQQAAIDAGLDTQTARELVLQTMRGATELAAQSTEPVSVLRERVTSKGGTTERALATLQQHQVAGAIVQAVHAARVRATELGEELGSD
ncbi:MAG TPA: pyrroline-5-carboxylate reductase [Burkholderiales bacterium]